jgi:hypothetical protein
MRTFLTVSIFLILLTSFNPGEPVATLNCKSQSGRTVFTATLPSCSYLEKAELNVDGSRLVFSIEDRSTIIFDPENKVLTVFLQSKSDQPEEYKFLKFWALPDTFKKIKSFKGFGSQFRDTYKFHAKMYATDPRRLTEPNTKTIELICMMEYEL